MDPTGVPRNFQLKHLLPTKGDSGDFQKAEVLAQILVSGSRVVWLPKRMPRLHVAGV